MASYNGVTFMGNIGRDGVVLRRTQTGRPVASFSVASNRKWTDDDGKTQEEVTWMNVTVWGRMAETCDKYLSKGDGVFVEGRLVNTQWTDKEGVSRYGVEIVARNVQFLPKGSPSSRAPHPADRDEPGASSSSRDDDGPPELPPPPESSPDEKDW